MAVFSRSFEMYDVYPGCIADSGTPVLVVRLPLLVGYIDTIFNLEPLMLLAAN